MVLLNERGVIVVRGRKFKLVMCCEPMSSVRFLRFVFVITSASTNKAKFSLFIYPKVNNVIVFVCNMH
jgi:hypothetical protein